MGEVLHSSPVAVGDRVGRGCSTHPPTVCLLTECFLQVKEAVAKSKDPAYVAEDEKKREARAQAQVGRALLDERLC